MALGYPQLLAFQPHGVPRSTDHHGNLKIRHGSEKGYLLHEWHYGPYRREVEIPDGFGAQVTATFGNGQLAMQLGRGRPDGRVVAKPRSYRS